MIAGLACLRQQLGVETGVLLERDLESCEGLAALLVLLGDLLADDGAAADDDGLDGDDHDVERPPFIGLREPGDERVDEERRRKDTHEGEWQRPQDRGIEEAADHEDEEQRLAEHERRCEGEDPDEEHVDTEPMLLPRRPQTGEHQVDPGRSQRHDPERGRLPGEVLGAGEEAKDGGGHQQEVPAPADHRVAESLPAGLRRRAHAERYSTHGRSERCRASRARHSHRNSSDGERPGDDRQDRHAEERRQLRCGSQPRILKALDAGRREVADLDEDVGQVDAREVDPAQEHNGEEQRDRDGRRHAGDGATAASRSPIANSEVMPSRNAAT